MDNTFFSIIIPVYNRAHLISTTIQSFLNQTYTHFEIIIVDDGSQDNTEQVVAAIKDNRIKYYKKENGERGAARNYGIKVAQGDYLNFFDSDDIAYPNHLEIANEAITRFKNPPVFHLGSEIKNEKNEVVHTYKVINGLANDTILIGNNMNVNSVFIKKEILEIVKFSEDRQLSGTEDWLFNLQLGARYDFMAYDKTITNGIIHHKERSMKMATGDSTLQRAISLERYLKEDTAFIAKYEEALPKINYQMLSLAALYYALEGQKLKALKWLFQALKCRPFQLFSKRVLAVLKHIIIA